MPAGQSIGNLNVTVTADASQVISEFEKLQAKMESQIQSFDTSSSKIATGIENIGLKAIAGARAISEIHKELMYVMDNVERIPGIPPEFVASIMQARVEFSNLRNSIDQSIASILSFAFEAARAVGVGAGMMTGADGDLGIGPTGRAKSDEDARAKDPKYDEKIDAARQHLQQTTQALKDIEGDRAKEIENYLDLANREETYSKASAIDTVQSLEAQAKANDDLLKAKKLRLELDKETAAIDEKLQAAEGRNTGAAIPAQERLNALKQQEWEVRYRIYNLPKDDDPADVEKLNAAKKQLTTILTEETPILKEQERVWESMGTKANSTVENMIVSGGSLRSTWQKLVKEMESDLVQMLLGDNLKNAFSSMFKGLFGGLQGMSAGGGSFLGLFGFAGGGNPSGPSIVGENGPELFVPSTSGLVVDNFTSRGIASSGSGMGGSVFNIDARGADQAAVNRIETSLKALDRSIEGRSIAANQAFTQRTTPAYQS